MDRALCYRSCDIIESVIVKAVKWQLVNVGTSGTIQRHH
jgi:hypothetical protein